MTALDGELNAWGKLHIPKISFFAGVVAVLVSVGVGAWIGVEVGSTGAVNELQVVLDSSDGLLYINGSQVSEFHGQPPQAWGATGLYAQSEKEQANDWRFLNITVVENQ